MNENDGTCDYPTDAEMEAMYQYYKERGEVE